MQKRRASGFHILKADRDFFEELKSGYFSQKGCIQTWKETVLPLLESPTMSFLMSVGIGSLCRKHVPWIPGIHLHIMDPEGAAKTQALQIMISLRADPNNLVWSFDEVATLELYTAAADGHFLCLDDVHVAIMTDDLQSFPLPGNTVRKVCNPANDVKMSLITASECSMQEIAPEVAKQVFEIQTQDKGLEIWPEAMGSEPWWMDTPIPALKENYGVVTKDILLWAKQKDVHEEDGLSGWAARSLEEWRQMQKKPMSDNQWATMALSLVGEYFMVEQGWIQPDFLGGFRKSWEKSGNR